MSRVLTRAFTTALRASQAPIRAQAPRATVRTLLTDTRGPASYAPYWRARTSPLLQPNAYGAGGTMLARLARATSTLPPQTPEEHYARAIARGAELGDFRDWKVSTAGSDVSFKTEGNGQDWPALVLEKVSFKDPNPRDIVGDNIAEFSEVTTLQHFHDAIVKVVRAEAPYLTVSDVEAKSTNEDYGIASLRRKALMTGLRESAIAESGLSPKDQLKALGMIEALNVKLGTGREFDMKVGSHTNYWPYWKNYLAPLVKLLGQYKEGDPGWHQINNRISYVTRHKTAQNRTIDERNIEESMGMALIYKPKFTTNGGQRVSLVEGSNPLKPEYELLSVAKENLPPHYGSFAGMRLVRDDKGEVRVDLMGESDSAVAEMARGMVGEPLPLGLQGFVESKKLSEEDCQNLNFRFFAPREKPRAGIPMDWDDNDRINITPTDISWWGHCHNEAPLNAMDIDPQKPVTFYRAAAGVPSENAVQSYTAEEIWDLAGAFVADHEDGYNVVSNGYPAVVDATTFVGIRNNGRSFLSLEVPGSSVKINGDLVDLINLNGEGRDPGKVFSPNVEKGDGTFGPNPLFVQVDSKIAGLITVDVADHGVMMETKYMVFDERGYPKEVDDYLEIPPQFDRFIKIGQDITSLNPDGRGGEVSEHYYNTMTQEYYNVVSVVNADNDYSPVEVKRNEAVKVKGLTMSAETQYDSSKELFEFYLADPGLPKTYDTSPGKAVWNYPVNKEKVVLTGEEVRVEEGHEYAYRTFKLRYETMGGPSRSVSFILKYNEAGEIIDDIGLDPLPDFAYRKERWVSAPVTTDVNGQTAVNVSALREGFLLSEKGNSFDDVVTELWKVQSAILYAGLKPNSPEEGVFLMETQEGEFVSFESKADFDAAVEADKARRE